MSAFCLMLTTVNNASSVWNSSPGDRESMRAFLFPAHHRFFVFWAIFSSIKSVLMLKVLQITGISLNPLLVTIMHVASNYVQIAFKGNRSKKVFLGSGILGFRQEYCLFFFVHNIFKRRMDEPYSEFTTIGC